MALRTPLTVSPHMYIGDSTGRPLDYGMVYFGEPDKDPEFYPIPIFSDDELTIPVSQPVRTKGGYLNDNKGDMAEIHAKELIYSVKVLDQYGRKIFYKGQSMRSTWNDDVIIRIDEAINEARVETALVAGKIATDAVTAAIEGVAIDANLVTDALIVTTTGVTQKSLNDYALKVRENTTVFLDANKIGLTKWVNTDKKPPYSAAEYKQAYDNGVLLASAINAASAAGAAKVVLERGNYPVCYSNSSGSTTINLMENSVHSLIKNTVNLDVDGNDSCLFVIFDSNNRSPYDNATAMQPYELRGTVFGLEGNTNLNIYGFDLKGDQYNRSWVGGEHNTEQTYGIFMGSDNINTKINIVGRGFRGDAVSGATRGEVLHLLYDNWEAGGISSAGVLDAEVGAYRSPRIDITLSPIYRNAVQIQSGRELRGIPFREGRVTVYFYNSSSALISSEFAEQCDFIYLPVGTKYVQIVARGDERTSPTVSYGNTPYLCTGSSSICEVRGEYYANHRGAISNLCSYTKIDANIHDNGTMKYGFPNYANTTRYGVNFEDFYVASLEVKGTISNGLQGVLCYARNLRVDADIKNITYSGVGCYGTHTTNITGTFDSVGELLGITKPQFANQNRVINLSGATIRNSVAKMRLEDFAGIVVNITGNTSIDSAWDIVGNGENVNFVDNTAKNVKLRYVNSFNITRAAQVKGNYATRTTNTPAINRGWSGLGVSGKISRDNYVLVAESVQRVLQVNTPNVVDKLEGVTFELNNPIEAGVLKQDASWIGLRLEKEVNNCTFKGAGFNIGAGTPLPSIVGLNYKFSNSTFIGTTVSTYIRETDANVVHKVLFKNCNFDLTTANQLFYNAYALVNNLEITFLDCKITSDVPKSLKLFSGETAKTKVVLDNCRLINVTSTDVGITVLPAITP